MTTIEKIIAGALSIGVLLAMDLLKIDDPYLKYTMYGLIGLLTGGHVVTNFPLTITKS